MSQSINMAASSLEEVNFNGTVVKKMNLNGAQIWVAPITGPVPPPGYTLSVESIGTGKTVAQKAAELMPTGNNYFHTTFKSYANVNDLSTPTTYRLGFFTTGNQILELQAASASNGYTSYTTANYNGTGGAHVAFGKTKDIIIQFSDGYDFVLPSPVPPGGAWSGCYFSCWMIHNTLPITNAALYSKLTTLEGNVYWKDH